ncbi:synaptonemal complex protein 1 isoform X1 [Thunnus maccoyii]|uniref:synaptonemal complex protein 1 isoform X1 n=1 Tax=Thunnus maccoyii TaxID=8240 RepID=UPI001C4B1563|nr:synaptonemal complex protein 1 isoform X1 [Thunnus maccoyii]XP_042262983.1 synaptonemal complex protein 1 isoform X1 [Thunnus maccoyii]
MERDRGFNFKLLVPPRVNNGQVSAVRPQEIVENCGEFMNTLQQGYSKCFDKEQNMPFPNTSMVAPTKPTRQDFPQMKVVPPMEKEENNCNPGQLYSKLFDEVDKIKCWKVKADSDTVQRERKLQENKRTIETQRKAIQELQFGNESLSIKLEEQISENEDLKNRNNATRNLCNILKDTFQRSAEKMHLFESEREETHHLLMENSESIQKLIAAFESLRAQAEVDQQEMLKVKGDLQQFEDLKDKYHQEYSIKEEEVVMLQTKLKDNVNELQKILRDLHETQDQCRQLQKETDQQHELLKSSKAEQESLLQKLHTAEQRCTETETSQEAIAAMLKQSKEEHAQIIQSKDLSLQELSRVKDQQAKKLEEIQTTIQELQNSLALEIQRVKECEDKFMANNEELERKNILLGEATEQSAKKNGQIKILENELDKASKSMEALKGKMDVLEVRVEELKAELSRKTEEAQLIKSEAEIAFAENEQLKKACETAETAHEDLKEEFNTTEIKVQELEGHLSSEMKKNEEYTFQMERLRKDLSQHEVKYEELLANFNELQSEKKAIEQLFESGSSNVKAIEANMKVSEEKAHKLTREIQRLEEENKCLREEVNSIKTNIQGRYQETETLQKKIEENCEHFQEEITEKEKTIKAVEAKLCNLRRKFETKLKAQEEYQKENKMLKKQIAKEIVKSSQLENVISGLHEESQNLKRLNEEEHQKLLKDLESKSTFALELENEVQKLRLTAAEAIKNKEDAELKCQHKIADMVALMEKHKSHYDRMVEEKDAELDENKKKEMKAVAHKKSLEVDVSNHKTENDQLKKQLMTEKTEKENLQKELTDLRKEISSVKIIQLSEASNKQSPAFSHKQGRCSETPKENSSKKHVFDFSETMKTPSYHKDTGSTAVMKKAESGTESIRTSCGTTPKTKEILNEDLKTPKSITNRVGGTSKIKSYRIRTPPFAEKAACWGKSAIQLDPKSDSSDQNDLLTFADAPAPSFSAPHSKRNMFKKSPVSHKSPGNSLKLAAMKRMRDAGWTAVTGCDKKKKKTNEKIFA